MIRRKWVSLPDQSIKIPEPLLPPPPFSVIMDVEVIRTIPPIAHKQSTIPTKFINDRISGALLGNRILKYKNSC